MALPKAKRKTATEKRQVKMRGNRKSIEQIHMGEEPNFVGQEIDPNAEGYSLIWGKSATWFNYFRKPKDYGYSISEKSTRKGLSAFEISRKRQNSSWLHLAR